MTDLEFIESMKTATGDIVARELDEVAGRCDSYYSDLTNAVINRAKELLVQPTPDAGECNHDDSPIEWDDSGSAVKHQCGKCGRVKSVIESATRPFVNAFASVMESKLEKNRHKGDREGWLKDTPRALFERLKQEVDELHAALADGTDVESVLSEAADVANFAMMIADSYRNRSPLRAAGNNKNT